MKSLNILIVLCVFSYSCQRTDSKPDHLIRGADVSFLPDLTSSGYLLKNRSGVIEDPLLTLKKSDVNTIRLRVWNQSNHPVSSAQVVSSLARQCRQQGFKVMLTLHYSDTWADPGQQQKPASWQGLSFNTLCDSVYDFTYRITKTIKPEYIQIGNEINGGLLWPEGAWTNQTAFKQLLEAGINAAKKAHPTTKIILHYAGLDGASTFYAELGNLAYDIIGLSYYPYWHGTNLSVLGQTIQQLKVQSGREVLIVETAYPFTLQWNDQTHNVIGLQNQLLPDYPASFQGQRDFVCRIKQIVIEAGALGFCYWGAEWVSYKGNAATNGSSWENQALWDFEGKAVPAMECFKRLD